MNGSTQRSFEISRKLLTVRSSLIVHQNTSHRTKHVHSWALRISRDCFISIRVTRTRLPIIVLIPVSLEAVVHNSVAVDYLVGFTPKCVGAGQNPGIFHVPWKAIKTTARKGKEAGGRHDRYRRRKHTGTYGVESKYARHTLIYTHCGFH